MFHSRHHTGTLHPSGASFFLRFLGPYWLAFVVAFFLVDTFRFETSFDGVGGPFISVVHTIVPIVLLLWTLPHVLRGYSLLATPQKVMRMIYARLSATLLVLVLVGTYGLLVDPAKHGRLIGP